MFQQQAENQRGGLQLHGHKVCQRAFRLLLGIGKNRAGRLRHAILIGEEECPVDQRFKPNRRTRLPPNSVRPLVVEYLQKLYNQVAEPLPESRSNEFEGKGEVDLVAKVKRRGKRPRHIFKLDDPNNDKCKNEGDLRTIKFLPPASLVDYHDLCQAEYPDNKIGRKIFCRVPE